MSLARQLDAYLAERNGRPFTWAGHNCCHFVADWVHVATGCNPMRGTPPVTSAARAARTLKRFGGLAGAWTRQLGRQPTAPAQAQLGDVVLVKAATVPGGATPGQTMGICAGPTVVVPGEDGALLHLPMAQAVQAWPLREPTWHSAAR